MRVVLLTADGLRHRYAAHALAERLDLVGLVSERKARGMEADQGLAPEDKDVLEGHLAERARAEQRLLGNTPGFPAAERLELPTGGVNAPDVVAWIEARRPEAVVLFGSSVIQAPLLKRFPGKVVNLHLGLSPYYRGSGTNFWPLVHRQPECVGVTVHLVTPVIDGGPVLAQGRPLACVEDGCHELGTKALTEGLRLLPDALARYLAGRLVTREQSTGNGKVFRRRDFTASAVRQMWHHFATGMMEEYLRTLRGRRDRYPIVELAA